MKLTILGTGVCVPVSGRCQSSYYLKTLESSFIFDMGGGAMYRMAQKKIDIFSIDSIFFSHLHADHSSDFVSFMFSTNTHPEKKREKKLYIIGPRGTKKWVNGIFEVFGPHVRAQGYECEIIEMLEGRFIIGSSVIKTFPVYHSEGAIGFRVEDKDGKVFAYSGDTGYGENLMKLGEKADVFLLECSFPDRVIEKHLNMEQALRIAVKSQCKKLILTHIYPEFEDYDFTGALSEDFSGEIIRARDLMDIDIV